MEKSSKRVAKKDVSITYNTCFWNIRCRITAVPGHRCMGCTILKIRGSNARSNLGSLWTPPVGVNGRLFSLHAAERQA
eukprot:1147489-Pelagomonas_calceolata.AAC.6